MARALVLNPRGSGRLGSPLALFTVTCYFFGTDAADAGLAGQPFELVIELPEDYTLGDLKGAVSSAVGSKATEVGLTIDASGIDLPSFEHGPP